MSLENVNKNLHVLANASDIEKYFAGIIGKYLKAVSYFMFTTRQENMDDYALFFFDYRVLREKLWN